MEKLVSKQFIIGGVVFVHGASRLASADIRELLTEEIDDIEEHYTDKIDILDITYTSEKTNFVGFMGHGYWYKNAWTSSDILTALYLNLNPDKRGLEATEDDDLWYFPPDYPICIKELTK